MPGYAICLHGGSLAQALEADDGGSRLRRALLLCGTAWENQIEVPESVPHPSTSRPKSADLQTDISLPDQKSCTRMDYDTTAQPWFLQPRWNTSGWAEHISHFGPHGVHDHKVTWE